RKPVSPLHHRHSVRHGSRAALVAVVFLAVLAGLSGCSNGSDDSGSDADAPKLRSLKVVLDWTPNTNHAGMFLADAEGWYRDAGLEVEFLEPSESSSLQLLAAGRADVAVSVAEEILPARAAGLPVRSV